jgi:sulfite reductase alpha subunit-like flavoprotein/nitric oxide synthase oxygenase domain/subunit/hemoglobin-like flavoprotein
LARGYSRKTTEDRAGQCPATGAVGAGCPMMAMDGGVDTTKRSDPRRGTGQGRFPTLGSHTLAVHAKATQNLRTPKASSSGGARPCSDNKPAYSAKRIAVAALPEVAEVAPSVASLADLEIVEGFPAVKALSEEDIVVVKGAWNRTLAWKDQMMESLINRWAHLDPEIYELLQDKWDELSQDMYNLIDKSVRALDPHTEVHHRESYTAGFPACITREFGDEPDQIIMHYNILGLQAKHWILLKDAFMFSMTTHNPWMYKEHDGADLEQGDRGAVARFFSVHVVRKAHRALAKHLDLLQSSEMKVVGQQARLLNEADLPEAAAFFRALMSERFPETLDYFAEHELDKMLSKFVSIFAMEGCASIGLRDLRPELARLAKVHCNDLIPSDTYSHMGDVLMDTLSEVFEMPEEVLEAWVYLYVCCVVVISAPMTVRERLYGDAYEFFEQYAKENQWDTVRLQKRIKEVWVEIGSTGTYTHTSEELAFGARLGWRNAPKCIGRIAWDTLLVRDKRHVTSPQEIFRECAEHLKIAANGGIVQSTMTVFAPKKPNERWGTRFWNHQFCRYAGWRQPDGSILGDPSNVELTELLVNRLGWEPPVKKTRFDPLPLVIQMPGGQPYFCEMDRELFAEIQLMHPKYPAFDKLELRWVGIPAINNFNLRIGGVSYCCSPFNGWFLDLEVARNLVERYGLGQEIAEICGLDTSTDTTGWRAVVYQEICQAVMHSFQKGKMSCVDHYTGSTQFLTHVDREKCKGREVPAQWSWIGGFVGVHCPVWHYEMRDFYLKEAQYLYMSDRWVVEDFGKGLRGKDKKATRIPTLALTAPVEDTSDKRRVLVLFSSTTGTAERFARQAAKTLGLGYRPMTTTLNALDLERIGSFTHILCFVSTFNDGVAPENGASFPEALKVPLLSRSTGEPIKYAVMGLGSTIYPKFCAFAKKVDCILQAAGGAKFAPTVLADETKNQAADYQQFLSSIRNELEPKAAPPDAVEPVLEVRLLRPAPAEVATACPTERRGHALAKLAATKELFASPTRTRSTRHLFIDISACSGMSYRTGGHISILPCNPEEEVLALSQELGLSEKELHSEIDATMVEGDDRYAADIGFKAASLYDALRWHLDITVRPSSALHICKLIREVGGMTAEEYKQLKDEGTEALTTKFWWVSRILRAFPQSRGKVTVAMLLGALGKQFPRLYSIASSNLVSPTTVEICVGLLAADGHLGLASGYLTSMKAGSPLWARCSESSFVLPESPSSPIVMVGAGTGIAPFLGFVQERTHLASLPDAVKPSLGQLFVGCRTSGERLGADACEAAMQAKTLTTYSVSLSRELGQSKRYVTDALREQTSEVWAAMQQPGCHYYFCGDGRMADSAYEALLKAIMQGSSTSRAKAKAHVDTMRAEGRYHLDVWGVIKHGEETKRLMKKDIMIQRWLDILASRDDNTAVAADSSP